MKWSRNDEDACEETIVLKFPSGIQVQLDLPAPPEPEDAQEGPARSASEAQAEPPGLSQANMRALIAWHMAGLSLFASGRQPSLREATEHARAVLLALEMERKEGNITHVASALGTSRRATREHLRRVGLYDWKRFEDGEEEDDDAHDDDVQDDDAHDDDVHEDDEQQHHEEPAANVE